MNPSDYGKRLLTLNLRRGEFRIKIFIEELLNLFFFLIPSMILKWAIEKVKDYYEGKDLDDELEGLSREE